MPFFQPFIKEFIAGDLVYGLGEQRGKYVFKDSSPPAFQGAATHIYEERYPPLLIDDYLVPSEEIYMRGFINRNQNDSKGHVYRLYKNRLNYIDSDHHIYPRYAKDFFKHLSNDKKYCSVIDKNQELDRLNLGRKCKGGLSWISKSNSLLVRDIHVHFILDGIDMKRVADKLNECDESGNKIKKITGQELRWLFRHRNHPEVRKKVQFWRNGQPVSPPWEDLGRHIWNNYERRLKEKENLGLDEKIYDGLSRLFNIP